MYKTVTPKDIVNYLDKYIIGQDKAKKTIAIALRNRYRRMNINKSLRNDIAPKNILMIGPTGVGKTEISRRLLKLLNFPFIKVEATKFTEVGYIGKEVDSIIKDLLENTIKNLKFKHIKKNKIKIKKIVEDKILKILINNKNSINNDIEDIEINNLKNKLSNKELEDIEIEINLLSSSVGVEVISTEVDDINNQIQSILKNISKNKDKIFKVKVKEARKILMEEEFNKNLNLDNIKKESINLIEQNGIVFIDEIDKICRKKNDIYNGIDVSREGVQRDLLSLIDGCTINTKHGIIKTDNILFIASGSFYNVDVSDLLPELQGRLPIKVKLDSLSLLDFEKILTKTKNSIINQYKLLIKTEKIDINFTDCSIKKIAEFSYKMNELHDNLGARRLYSILEELLEDILFNAPNISNKKIIIDENYVNLKLSKNFNNIDLYKYII
ncbi:ATP-dependent protease ATPase subunit HslU [endosymbiont of Pachyrhynchus infernalis]|uniref:ATP-dependent protease ATPase subunit HslU n=1 Tax=endosymbiont of Pachyrhynchus infernalis TaxID=1971488 RepID=UPI000DC6F717|nr:ATP-dependent protease ATPase subunit HslU [endosymbiont of Pachyrhynchus infernalis]BBA84943.1 ATP-dependent protease ATPase subunit HslU [endosymbiont of Pachyrhynchus infernalis]